MKKHLLRAGLGIAAASLLAPMLAACGNDEPTLVVYNAQHEQLLKEIAPEFTKETGIKVELRNGQDLTLSNQIVQEGKASPADVFLTENSPAMSQVEAAGLFDKLPASLVAPIPAQYRPRSDLWTGFVARSTTLVYNTDQVKPADLPASILDLAKPRWKGRIAFSPTGADFQAIVAAMIDLEGEAAAKAWLEGLKANGKVYDGNNLVLEAVNSGQVQVGIVYHYYWERDRKENGDVSDHSAQYYFKGGDPGAFVSVSGAGVLKSSDMKDEARKFIAFLVGEKGQQILADSYALEYPLNPKVELTGVQMKFSQLQPPNVNVSDLNAKKVVDLMTAVGFL
jgi:iron(III) transport system substrate-binding protein